MDLEKKKERYLKYAEENGLKITKKISTKKIYALCNRHRDDYLIYDVNFGHGTRVDTSCESFCRGWYVNEEKCGCGTRWHLEYGLDDGFWGRIDLIDSNEPFGTPRRIYFNMKKRNL